MARPSLFRALGYLIVCVALAFPSAAQSAQRLLVFAPASMAEVMERIVDEFSHPGANKVSVSVAGTGQLARQVAAGAPVDVFISADRRWIDWLIARDLIVADSPTTIAANSLVIAVRRETENWVDPFALLTQGRFAMGEPEAVPAGTYARAALTKRGIWEAARKNAVFGENVRLALKQLERGEVEAAIVYRSDLEQAPVLRPAYTFGAREHPVILYTAALVRRNGAHPAALDFLIHLASKASRQKLREAGFVRAGVAQD